MDLKAVKFLLQLPNLLPICSHAGVTIVRVYHDLIDDNLRVSMDVKTLNPKFINNAQTVDQCFVLRHIIGGMEVKSNHRKESITFTRDRHHASPGTVEGDRAIKIQAPVLLNDQGDAESQSIRPQNLIGPRT
jgi:hypothetical protein